MSTGRLVVASGLTSYDGLYHLRYPAGNAPVTGAALAGNAVVSSAVSAALSTGIQVAGTASAATSASGTLTSSGGATFAPASGVSISAPSGASNGSSITLTGPTSWGSKPYAAEALLWVPGDTSGNPSSLGRITSLLSALLGMTWQSSGGPTGAGCYAGTPSTNTAPNSWGIGIDLPQWSGWAAADPHGGGNGYYFNDFGASTYIFHREWRNFGHLDSNSALSYNGIGNYNAKNVRIFPTSPLNSVGTGTNSNAGDMFIPTNDQTFQVENITNTWGLGTDFPSGGGSQDWGQECVNATVAAENAMNGSWLADEKLFTSNSNATAGDANVMWRVPASPTPGPFPLGSIYGFPVTTYHEIGWQFLNSSVGQTLAGNLRGTQSRLFAQYVVEGNDGSGRPSAPVGSYNKVAQLYIDDSACRVVATNSSTWGSETDLQPQPPTAWTLGGSNTTISVSAYDLPVGWYLWVVDSTNAAHYAGQRTA